jgi:hypothetical protein
MVDREKNVAKENMSRAIKYNVVFVHTMFPPHDPRPHTAYEWSSSTSGRQAARNHRW